MFILLLHEVTVPVRVEHPPLMSFSSLADYSLSALVAIQRISNTCQANEQDFSYAGFLSDLIITTSLVLGNRGSFLFFAHILEMNIFQESTSDAFSKTFPYSVYRPHYVLRTRVSKQELMLSSSLPMSVG